MSSTFERKEVKYVATAEQAARFVELVSDKLHPDAYGRSHIKSTYFDTPDLLLATRSISKPLYKEKLRVRQYGGSDGSFKSWDEPDAHVFVELKKKFDGITYKRRIEVPGSAASSLIFGEDVSEIAAEYGIEGYSQKQIMSEISSMASRYDSIAPVMDVSYVRTAYACDREEDIRMTVDEDVKCSVPGQFCEDVVDSDARIIEVKVPGAYPLWLVDALSKSGLRPQSFSKYGLSSQIVSARRAG